MQKWEYILVYMRTFAEMRRELTRYKIGYAQRVAPN